MSKSLVEMTVEIVQAQIGLTPGVDASDITRSLREVFGTLQKINRAETERILVDDSFETTGDCIEANPIEPTITPEESIQNDKIVCLECGKEMRQLTRTHLAQHDMTPREYRKKYGFTMRTPLCAKSVTKARKKAAKKRGLPANLAAYLEKRRASKMKTMQG